MPEILVEIKKEIVLKQEPENCPISFKLNIKDNELSDNNLLCKEIQKRFKSNDFEDNIFFYFDEKIGAFIFLGKFPF